MPSPSEYVALLTGAGVVGAAVGKGLDLVLGRNLAKANADKVVADTKATEHATVAGDVATLRAIIGEVRASEAKKAERIDGLERRLDLLEERERHMLTRAAVHEAWDVMAFAILSQVNPEHPPPPPLTPDGHTHDD